jgi:type IV secretory pathway component VirB8
VAKNEQLMYDRNALDHSITEMVESGQYYKDARDWYAQVYLAPAPHRSLLVIVGAVIAFSAAVVVVGVSNLFPLTTKVPFVTWSRESGNYYPKLIKLAEETESAELIMARYFLKKYIVDREEYRPGEGENQRLRMMRVLTQSSQRIGRSYEDMMNPRSPQSPEVLYARHTTRVIEDVIIELPSGKKNLTNATVYFNTLLKRKGSKDETRQKWKAEIGFSLTDVDTVLKKKSQLKLLVSEYKVTEVPNEK